MSNQNPQKKLTEFQFAVVEAYRRQLAMSLPEVEILDAFGTDGIIEVKLNDASMQDYSTITRVIQMAMDVEDQFNVTLLPHTIPHES